MSGSSLIRGLVARIEPASAEVRDAARARARGPLGALYQRLAVARDAAAPTVARRALLYVADPAGAAAVAAGDSPVAALARQVGVRVVAVALGDGTSLPAMVVSLAPDGAIAAADAGAALCLALAEAGLDLLGFVSPGEPLDAAALEWADHATAVGVGVYLTAATLRVPLLCEGPRAMAARRLAEGLAPSVTTAFLPDELLPHPPVEALGLAPLLAVPLCAAAADLGRSV